MIASVFAIIGNLYPPIWAYQDIGGQLVRAARCQGAGDTVLSAFENRPQPERSYQRPPRRANIIQREEDSPWIGYHRKWRSMAARHVLDRR